jgi:hypothetical protein
MKLKFVAYWNTDYNIYQFINDIWNIDGQYDEYLTYKDDYDYLIILNKVDNNIYKPRIENTYGICIEPYWSNSFDKNLLSYCKKIVTYQPDKYNYERTIFAPLLGTHRLYNAEYHGEINPEEGITKKIIQQNFIKSKKLSIIINYHWDAYSHHSNESLYNKRDMFVRKLIASNLDFDMFGQDWPIFDRRYKGFLPNKIDGIKDYEYTICLENSAISGEITEKIIDAILCKTIPIYNGNKSIFDFYGNCCEYLEYDGNEIQRILEITSSNKTYLDYDFEKAQQLYLYEYNPIKIILEDIKANENIINR